MPDVVVHLAALSPVRESFERPFEYQQANFLGTMNIAHALLELPDYENRKIIAASTAEVYGLQNKELMTENLPLKPSSPYSVTKAASDLYLQMMFHTYELHGTILRPTNSYGRKIDTSFLVEYLIIQMLKDEEVYIGSPESVRDYMYVDDHVNAYLTCLSNPKAMGETFNFCTGRTVTIKQLAQMTARVCKFKGELRWQQIPSRPLDIMDLVGDYSKARRVIGWKPKYTLEEGLELTADNWRNALKER